MTEVLIAERQRRTERESPQVNQLDATCDRRYFIQAGIAAAASALGLRTATLFASEESPAVTLQEAKEKPLETLSFDKITEKLKPLWEEQRRELMQRKTTLEDRCDKLKELLANNSIVLDAFEKQWGTFTDTLKNEHGATVPSMDVYTELLNQAETMLQKAETDLGTSERENADKDPEFHCRYLDIIERREALEEMHKRALMTNSTGDVVGLYPEEKNRNPDFKHDEYIQTLAQLLYTPERLALFIRYCTEYTKDIPHKDHWQTPEETLLRVKNGKYLGDCEDIAILVKEILILQKKKPFVVIMEGDPGHATCIYIEKNEHGKFDAYDFGTHELDRNGCQFGVMDDGVIAGVGYGKGPKEAEKGFDTAKDALCAVMSKHENAGLINMKEWASGPGFFVARDYRDREKDEKGKLKDTDERVYVAFDDLEKRYVSEIEVAPLPPSE